MRFTRAFLFVILVTTIAVGAQSLLSDPEHVKPDHVARPEAGASLPPPLVAVGGDLPDVIAMEEWFDGVARAEWYAGVEAELERQASEAAARARAGGSGRGGGAGSCGLTGWTLPDEILIRESRCSEAAFNATGCNGRGCVGAAQLDLGHFANPSPWGGVGACWGLDPYSIPDQQECVRRLSGNGSNLAPWRG